MAYFDKIMLLKCLNSLPVPSREELSGNETPKDELTSSYTIPPQANANDGSYVLDDPSEELERELASTKI